MTFCEEIKEAKRCSAKMAHKYAIAATYGNATEEMLFNLVRLNTMIRVLERNQTEYRHVKVNSATLLQGQTVPFSSLTKQNNTLILDLSKPQCLEIEIRPCLSDTDICKIVEQLKILCYSSNC